MARIRLTDRAAADLGRIHDYVALRNPAAAKALLARIRAAADLAAEFPKSARAGLRANTREKLVRGLPYVIVYRVDRESQDVVVLNVIHTARRRSS